MKHFFLINKYYQKLICLKGDFSAIAGAKAQLHILNLYTHLIDCTWKCGKVRNFSHFSISFLFSVTVIEAMPVGYSQISILALKMTSQSNN